MILLNQSPPGADQDLSGLYQRMSHEGLVHSTLMRGEIYESSDAFDENWACSSITWSAGGEEQYWMKRGGKFSINPAGALTLAAGARYDYAAGRDHAFYSNMITFPRWMTKAASLPLLDDGENDTRRLSTRMLRPDAVTETLMNEIIAKCRRGYSKSEWFIEKTALLYGRLLDAEYDAEKASGNIDAAKPATQKELARRINRAQQFMLQSYRDMGLDLERIAKEACLSPFHLIRVFKTLSGVTPIHYLTAVRLEAALRLLRETKMTATEIAALVGFGNRAAFSRAFSRHHGFAPSAVRGLDRPPNPMLAAQCHDHKS